MSSASPSSIETELRLATEAYRSGNLNAAEARVDKLLSQYPNRPEIHLAKGIIQIGKGDQVGGLNSLRAALALVPNDLEALAWAAFASLNLQQFSEAETYARRLTELAPQNARSFYLLANALRALDRTEEGLQAIDQSLALRPDDPDSLVTKARLLKEWQLPALAIDIYRRVLAVRPSPPAAVDLAKILLNENHQQEALDVLDEVLPGIPVEHQPHALIAQAHTEMGHFAIADEHWDKAIRYAYDRNAVVESRARAEIASGRFDVAEAILSAEMSAGTSKDSLFAVLSTARKMRGEDQPLLAEMEKLAESTSLSGLRLATLCYALGKSFDDLKEYDRAIGYFDRANEVCLEIYPARRAFSQDAARRFTDFVIHTFTADMIEDMAEFGDPSTLPLFVVGMMRSGTTLTDSILSAHSLVKDGGEQAFWPERGIELLFGQTGEFAFNRASAFKFASEYLKQIEPKSPLIKHVVDKNPANFDLTGLLACVFPSTKFVHLKRNAADNLLSIWMTPVSGSVAYASSKENLAFVYREHLRLLDHFQSVLPANQFHSLKYEDLTSTPKPTIESLLAFVGLESEPACFTPEQNVRAVLTPSVHQVRQPIHSGSQARWKNYEPWLGAFSELTES